MGKGGNTQVKLTSNDDKNTNEKMEILLHGKYYDLTNFKHPGGGVIKFYMNNNIDATEAFNNFHLRSKKVLKILSHLPTRSNNEKEDVIYLPGQKKLLDDFNAFQDELKKEGYFEPSISHVCLRIFEILFLHAIGFYLLFNNHIILGTCILGLVSGRCGWLMHEGGHYSLTGKIALDKALQVVLYGIGCGMSASWWRSQHNRHHAMPQKLGYDVDLQTLPLVCFTEKVAKRVGIPMKWWLRIQAFSFPVVTTLLVALGWQLYLHPRHIIRSKQSSEALMFAIRYASIYYFIIGKFGWSQGIALYLFYNWFAATYIFINFAVSHTHLPTVAKDDTKVSLNYLIC